jgi:hypothetical protein
MGHVMEALTCNGDVTLHMIGWKRWVRYACKITMKVKGEVSIAEGVEILVDHDLKKMVKIPNVFYGKLDDLELQVSILHLHIANSM